MVEWNKRCSPLTILSCESSVSVKEKPGRKNDNNDNNFTNTLKNSKPL